MRDQDVWFIVKLVSSEPGIDVQSLRERYRNHGGLSDEQAANDILEVMAMGYIAGSVRLTEAGGEYLKKP
jgi:hypothetical protein